MLARGAGDGESTVVNLVRAQANHGMIVQGDDVKVVLAEEAGPAVARQLPPAPEGFLGREAELRAMDAVMDGLGRGRHAEMVVSGMIGVGKTALVRHWAAENKERFPGGQLYVDYTDYRHENAIYDVLGALLNLNGVSQPPAGLNERASRFRSLTADRPVLVLVDNAARSAQVRLLVPGAAGSALLVATRHRLGKPVLEAAKVLPLSPLNDAEAARLLLAMLDEPTRATLTPDVLQRLVGYCGGLPKAVQIVAAMLEVHDRWSPESLADYLADKTHRLTRLAVEDCAIGPELDVVARALEPEVRKAYLLLGTLPDADFSAESLARGLGVLEEEAQRVLHRLCDINLARGSLDRYGLHSLIRLHAQGSANGDREEADMAKERVEGWYLSAAQAAERAISDDRNPRLVWSNGIARRQDWFSPQAATRWYESERRALMALLFAAAEEHRDARVLELSHALWPLQRSRTHHETAALAQRKALVAAVNLGDGYEETRALVRLACAYAWSGKAAEARRELARAQASTGDSDDWRAIALVDEAELELDAWLDGVSTGTSPPHPRTSPD